MARTPLPGLSCKNILCWVGSLERVDAMVPFAKELARQSGGRCQVVMGLDSGRQHSASPFQTPLTPEVIIRAERKLNKLYGAEANTMVLPGHPVLEVRRYACNHGVDLIVMGEQGALLEQEYGVRMADRAPCTVMILLPPKHGEAPERSKPSKE